jgi:hypothetical protein
MYSAVGHGRPLDQSIIDMTMRSVKSDDQKALAEVGGLNGQQISLASGHVTYAVRRNEDKSRKSDYIVEAELSSQANDAIHLLESFAEISASKPKRNLSMYIEKHEPPREMLDAEPDLESRLRRLLSVDWDAFMERFGVQGEVRELGGFLVGGGCRPHACGSEEAVFLINLTDGKIHCAIRSDDYKGVKTFSEDPTHFPEAVLKSLWPEI